ncbi:MAG: hypothetical protein ACREP8_13200 [Candidatus Binatia bacterium]
MLLSIGAVHHAGAACQPYKPDPAFLADLQKDDFHARVFPTAPQQPSPGEKQKLRVIARERRPENTGDLAQMEGFWRVATGAPLPYPMTGRAPFHWKLDASSVPVPDPVKIEFDGNGDGKPDLVQEIGKRPKSALYIYDDGDYEFVMRIHDRSGRIHTYKGRLRVLSPADFDAQLQTVWRDLKGALRRGDRNAALECIHTQSRNRYREIFVAIPDLSSKVDEILTTIHSVENRQGEAVYEMLRKEGSDTLFFEVRFVADLDAVWRIRSF